MSRITLIKKRKHRKIHGFLRRGRSSSGSRILSNRRQKGRNRLAG